MSSRDFKDGMPYPKEEEGTEYIVVGDDTGGIVPTFPIGTIVKLVGNDNTECCYFEDCDGFKGHEYWHLLERVRKKVWEVGQIEIL